jgi:hypothetical protein
MVFFLKLAVSASVIAFTSWLAGRRPVLAGFIVALPLISMLSVLFAHAEHRNMELTNRFAVSIVTAVPLSLTFFLPFVANRWLKMGFLPTYALAVLCVFVSYGAYNLFTKGALLR